MQTHAAQSPAAASTRSASPSFTHVETLLDPPDRFIDIGHAEVAYRRVGQGPDVLFVHGWPVNASTYRGVVAALQGEYTCHLIDLPGAGLTRWTDAGRIGFAPHAETVAEVIRALGLSQVALIAHDSGGAIARLAAATLPGVVTGLVVSDTEIPGHMPALTKLMGAAAAIPGGARLFLETMRIGPIRRSRRLGFGTCFGDRALVDGEFRALTIDPILGGARRREGAIAFMKKMNHHALDGLAEAHQKLEMPVRLIWGHRNPVFPLDEARSMVSSFGGECDLVELPEGWLFSHEEFPTEYAELARPLLERAFG